MYDIGTSNLGFLGSKLDSLGLLDSSEILSHSFGNVFFPLTEPRPGPKAEKKGLKMVCGELPGVRFISFPRQKFVLNLNLEVEKAY